MGAGVIGKVQAAAQGTTLGIIGAEHHPIHPGLHQRSCAHGAGFQGHKQGAAVETPVAQHLRRLLQGHQFGMAERIAFPFPLVASPADATSGSIQDHGRHRHFTGTSGAVCFPHQPTHPQNLLLRRQSHRRRRRLGHDRCHEAPAD